MSNHDTEPSIEEILSSIRQTMIKSSAEEKNIPQPSKLKNKESEKKVNEDILELTKMVAEDGTIIDLKNQTQDLSQTKGLTEELISSAVANQTAQVFQDFSTFAETSYKERNKAASSLEDMVSEILKPFLKSWLDQNLPILVERLVQKEIEKISGRD